MIQSFKNLRSVVHISWRTVELKEIDFIDTHIFKAVFYKSSNVFIVISVCGMRIESSSAFGGNKDLLLPTFHDLSCEPLGKAIAVHICGINKVHTEVDRPVQSIYGHFLIKRLSPSCAELPCTE